MPDIDAISGVAIANVESVSGKAKSATATNC